MNAALSMSLIVENGDVCVWCFPDGHVTLTVRDMTEQERHATVRMTSMQAHALADVLMRAEDELGHELEMDE